MSRLVVWWRLPSIMPMLSRYRWLARAIWHRRLWGPHSERHLGRKMWGSGAIGVVRVMMGMLLIEMTIRLRIRVRWVRESVRWSMRSRWSSPTEKWLRFACRRRQGSKLSIHLRMGRGTCRAWHAPAALVIFMRCFI
jgi:hypothetical protein